MKNCTCCGAVNPDAANYCEKCGAKIAVPPPPPIAIPMERDFRFNCPFCNQKLEASEDMSGAQIDCPSCNKQIQIPSVRTTPLLATYDADPCLSPSAPSAARRKRSLTTVVVLSLAGLLAIAFTAISVWIFKSHPDSKLAEVRSKAEKNNPYRNPSATPVSTRNAALHEATARTETGTYGGALTRVEVLTRASDGATTPTLMANARSEAARQVRNYLAAVAQRAAATTRAFLSAECKEDFLTAYNVLVQSGWRYAEDRSRILRETVSPDGACAVVTAALVYQGSGRLMLYHNDFYLTLEQGEWKVLGVRQAVKLLDNVHSLGRSDYTANLAQPNDKAALFDAVTHGCESLVHLHLAFGADANAKDNEERTVLMTAVTNGNEKIIGLLLEKGANVNAKDRYGGTVLMLAVKSDNEKVMGLLLEKGANINTPRERDGMTPLLLAVREGREPLVRLLLGKGAEVNAKAKESFSEDAEPSWTALMFAAQKGREEIVRLLLDRAADVNAKNADSWTALMFAAEKGHEQIVRWLLEKGADARVQSAGGSTALTLAMFQICHEVGTDEYRGNGKFAKISRLLIEKGADPNAIVLHCNTKKTVLQDAISSGYDDIACLLIEKGADIGVKNEQVGYSTLMEATSRGRLQIVRLLLKKGADVNEKTARGTTALGIVLGSGHDAIARLLLEHGAKTSSQQEEQWVAMLRKRAPSSGRETE